MAKKNNNEQDSLLVSNNSNSDITISKSNIDVVPYVFSTDRIEKSNCKICTCDYRDEAEGIYECQKRKNYSAIKRYLKENYDFDATIGSIKNHMLYHYKAMQNNAAMQEYADDIQKWVNMQTNKVSSLKSRIAVLERTMFMISQESEDLDIVERRKSAETVKKLAETIITCESKLMEYQEQVKPVALVVNQLRIIVNDELAHIDNSKTKKVVATILTRLNESIGDMIIE